MFTLSFAALCKLALLWFGVANAASIAKAALRARNR